MKQIYQHKFMASSPSQQDLDIIEGYMTRNFDCTVFRRDYNIDFLIKTNDSYPITELKQISKALPLGSNTTMIFKLTGDSMYRVYELGQWVNKY